MFKIMEQSNPKITNNRLLQRNVGTYALILHCRHERIIDTGKLGKRIWGHPFDYNFIPFKIDYDGERLIFENGMSIIF